MTRFSCLLKNCDEYSMLIDQFGGFLMVFHSPGGDAFKWGQSTKKRTFFFDTKNVSVAVSP